MQSSAACSRVSDLNGTGSDNAARRLVESTRRDDACEDHRCDVEQSQGIAVRGTELRDQAQEDDIRRVDACPGWASPGLDSLVLTTIRSAGTVSISAPPLSSGLQDEARCLAFPAASAMRSPPVRVSP